MEVETNRIEEYKMYLVIRSDLHMPPGKLAVQSGHAFQLHSVAVYENHRELYDKYTIGQAVVKVAVKAKDEDHLVKIEAEATKHDIPNLLITDAGRTVFGKPTKTVLVFGPCLRSQLPSKLKRLQLYEDSHYDKESV